MDAVLNDPFGYNDRIGRRLYDEYLTEQTDPEDHFDISLRSLISSMVKRMNAWSETLEKHTHELNVCAESLSSPDINPEDLKRLTESILDTVSSMQKNGAELQTEMLTNSKEVIELR